MGGVDLVFGFLMNVQFGFELITARYGGRALGFLLGPLLPALAFQLRFFPQFDLTLTLLEGLAGFSDGAPRSDVMRIQTAQNQAAAMPCRFLSNRGCGLRIPG